MDSDKSSTPGDVPERPTPGVLVGRSVAVRRVLPEPAYFTDLHRQWIGETGRVHAVVASHPRDNPLVKVGFASGTQIVFFRLSDLALQSDEPPEPPRRHGKRGSHLPG